MMLLILYEKIGKLTSYDFDSRVLALRKGRLGLVTLPRLL